MARNIFVFAAIMCSYVCLPCVAASATSGGDREAAARDFIDCLAKGDFAGAEGVFDAATKRALPADALAQTWKSVQAAVGSYERQEAVRTARIGGNDCVYVTCRFERGLLDAKMVFNSAGEVVAFGFVAPQAAVSQSTEPLPAYLAGDGVRETQVSVGDGKSALPGTLTKPKGAPPYAAVVLVHGSGPNDRDETVGLNKPFRDLARGLAANGVAVLRYDKRTLVFGSEMRATAGTLTVKQEAVDDALAAVKLLRADKEIDPGKIFVLGHSLGGYLAPKIGKLDSRIAGLIILAGNSRPLEDLILGQTRYICSLNGPVRQDMRAQMAAVEAQVARVKNPTFAATRYSPGELPLGIPQAYWADLKSYDPVLTAAGLGRPILILWGERDYQVTRADFDGWRKGLSASPNATFKSYPALNHLFMEGQGRSTPAEYQRAGHVPEQVILDICRWIKESRPESGHAATEGAR